MNLTHEQILALDKLLTKEVVDEARDNLPAGEYEVNVLLSASLSFKKGEDHERIATCRIPTKALISVLLGKLNAATGESSMGLLEEALLEAHDLGDTSAGSAILEGDTSFAKGLKLLNETVAKQEPTQVRGRVTPIRRQVRAVDTDNLSIAQAEAVNELLAGGGE